MLYYFSKILRRTKLNNTILLDAIKENAVMLIFFLAYGGYVLFHLYREKSKGGKLIKVYKHNSSSKTFGKVMIFIGVFYMVIFFMQSKKSFSTTFTFVLFALFIAMMAFITIRDIYFYENGVSFGGKFTFFSDMKDVRRIGKDGVQVVLKKKRFGDAVYMRKIVDEKEFISQLKKRMKMVAKQAKKEICWKNCSKIIWQLWTVQVNFNYFYRRIKCSLK